MNGLRRLTLYPPHFAERAHRLCDALPRTRSEERRWTSDVRRRLLDWVASIREVTCDAAAFLDGVAFPAARPGVTHAERTFWEKATAIHVFCLQEHLHGERFSRHWHDLAHVDRREVGLAARRQPAEIGPAQASCANAVFAVYYSSGGLHAQIFD